MRCVFVMSSSGEASRTTTLPPYAARTAPVVVALARGRAQMCQRRSTGFPRDARQPTCSRVTRSYQNVTAKHPTPDFQALHRPTLEHSTPDQVSYTPTPDYVCPTPRPRLGEPHSPTPDQVIHTPDPRLSEPRSPTPDKVIYTPDYKPSGYNAAPRCPLPQPAACS